MKYAAAKKYRRIFRDKANEVAYVIYTNKNLTKKEAFRVVRYYLYSKNLEIPARGSKITIITDD